MAWWMKNQELRIRNSTFGIQGSRRLVGFDLRVFWSKGEHVFFVGFDEWAADQVDAVGNCSEYGVEAFSDGLGAAG